MNKKEEIPQRVKTLVWCSGEWSKTVVQSKPCSLVVTAEETDQPWQLLVIKQPFSISIEATKY